MAINETIKLVLAILVGAAVLYGGQTIMDWKEGAEQNEIRGRRLEATVGIVSDGAKADVERGQVNTGLATGRDQFEQDYQEASTNEPETAARADRAVPVSVRNAFKSRRLARERLGCAGGKCDEGPATDAAPEW